MLFICLTTWIVAFLVFLPVAIWFKPRVDILSDRITCNRVIVQLFYSYKILLYLHLSVTGSLGWCYNMYSCISTEISGENITYFYHSNTHVYLSLTNEPVGLSLSTNIEKNP